MVEGFEWCFILYGESEWIERFFDEEEIIEVVDKFDGFYQWFFF